MMWVLKNNILTFRGFITNYTPCDKNRKLKQVINHNEIYFASSCLEKI